MRLEIRTALPADAPALTRIAHAAKRHWDCPQAWLALWAPDLTVSADFIRAHAVRCAVRDGQIVGFYAFSNEGNEFEVEHMWVDPPHIGTGVGRDLFRDAVETARLGGGALLRIASDPHAEGFYRAMGARPAGRVATVPRGRTLPVLVFDLTSTEGFEMSDDLVRLERRGHVGLVTLNRPEKKNAFNNAMYVAGARAFLAARADRDIRVLLVTGAGSAFCAGQDFTEMNADAGAEHGFPAFIEALADCDKPVITAVNGVGIGLGLTMLLHTDINYIAEGARLRLPFVTLGVVPEAASSYLLPIVVGAQQAAEILFTARWITAEESVALDIAFAVVPADRLLETAFTKAEEIAMNPPAAVRHTKRLLRVWRRQAISAARAREDEAFQQRLGTPENLEAIRAFFERRPADFSNIEPE